MATPSRKRKTQSDISTIEPNEFHQLGDKAIIEKFESMSLDQIAKLSQKNQILMKLAAEFFQQNYPDKWLVIVKTSNGDLELDLNETFVSCFHRFFQNVTIQLPSAKDGKIENMQRFLLSHCSANLKRIHFHSGRLPKTFGEGIVEILKNVEKIVFDHCSIKSGSNFFDNILQYCQNLMELYVLGRFATNIIDDLLFRKFPTLKSFGFYFRHQTSINNVIQFLQNNPNITRLTVIFVDLNNGITKDNETKNRVLELIKWIADNFTGIEELLLSFDGNIDVSSFNFHLKVICARNRFKRLELKFKNDHIAEWGVLTKYGTQLAELKFLKGFHLSNLRDTFVLPPKISLNNLELLQLRFDFMTDPQYEDDLEDEFFESMDSEVDCDEFDFNLPNLKEIHLVGLNNIELICAFIRRAPKLEKVFLFNCQFAVRKIKVADLNIDREKLVDASPLIIFADKGNPKSTKLASFGHKLVQIKYVHFDSDVGRMRHPFIEF